MQSATSNLNYQINVVEHNIGLQNVVEWQCKVAENGNTQAKYLKIVFKCRSWVNALSYMSSLKMCTCSIANIALQCKNKVTYNENTSTWQIDLILYAYCI